MARKLKPHEERIFFEAAPSFGHGLSVEGFQAPQPLTPVDRALFDKHLPSLVHVELLVDEELGPDDWF